MSLKPRAPSRIAIEPQPPIYFTPIKSQRCDTPPLPKRTRPNAEGKPFFQAGGDDGPQKWAGELRRHLYRQQGIPVHCKVKMTDEKWVNWYRVIDVDGTEGWQTAKPDGYVHIPYVTSELDPFDSELRDDFIFWPEGEKDVESLGKFNLPAFTFGGGDGLPDQAAQYVTGRKIVVLADNDRKGRDHAEKKARSAHSIAASVRIVHFPDLPNKGDVSDFFAGGGMADELMLRVEKAPTWEEADSSQELRSADDNLEPARELVFARLSDIEPEPISWIWPDRVPLGKLTLFTGSPDVGKTLALMDIAARITNGELWPDGSGSAPVGSVLFLTAEDGIADTIRPRAEAAGANLDRIHVLQAAFNEEGQRSVFSLQADLALLGQKLDALGDVKLIGIDPVTSYLGAGKIDSYKNSDVRAVLTPLKEFAEQHGVAVCGITHPPKQTTKAMNAVSGSLGFVAAARATYLFIADPQADRTMMLPIKKNVGRKSKSGLAYRIPDRPIAKGIIAPYIVWDTEPVVMTADEALAAENRRDSDRSAKDDAISFLEDLLADSPMNVADIEREARAAGYLGPDQSIGQSKPFRSAREKLGIKPEKLGLNDGWSWALPKVPATSEGAF